MPRTIRIGSTVSPEWMGRTVTPRTAQPMQVIVLNVPGGERFYFEVVSIYECDLTRRAEADRQCSVRNHLATTHSVWLIVARASQRLKQDRSQLGHRLGCQVGRPGLPQSAATAQALTGTATDGFFGQPRSDSGHHVYCRGRSSRGPFHPLHTVGPHRPLFE